VAAVGHGKRALGWDKQHPVLTRKDMMGAFEICFYGWKEDAGHKFYGPNNATDVWPGAMLPRRVQKHVFRRTRTGEAMFPQTARRHGCIAI